METTTRIARPDDLTIESKLRNEWTHPRPELSAMTVWKQQDAEIKDSGRREDR